ncbi:rRNA methyltransferase 1, mitochondrial [Teratosphaeria destructans]|uniref:rRNA methyltransferase 1, mitochondrial n=1 Tax=Teratosphaeria destructans TaxID=418781 RepID=A0A9W7W0H9_9PEZI|nr:rRNA methyltransferase 1, mitochondrial [Teratosphaeria destructans]
MVFGCRMGAVVHERRRELGAEATGHRRASGAEGNPQHLQEAAHNPHARKIRKGMLSSHASSYRLRIGLYLDLCSVLCRNVAIQARQKSTVSAIKHGLRASKERPGRGRDRSARGPSSRSPEHERPSRSFERSDRPQRYGDGRGSRSGKTALRESGSSKELQEEKSSFSRRRDPARSQSGQHEYFQRSKTRDEGDGDSNRGIRIRQARPSRQTEDHDPFALRILKYTSRSGEVFSGQATDLDADIESLVTSTLAIQAADSAGTRASLDVVRGVRRKLKAINSAIQEWTPTSADGKRPSPAQQLRRRLVDAGAYIREDEIQDLEAEQSMIMERLDRGRFALLLKGTKANSVVRPDATLQELDSGEGVSGFREDRRGEHGASVGADARDEERSRSRIPDRSRNDEYRTQGDGIPLAVPRTTAASEFLYGANVITAALRAKQRKLYVLYTAHDSLARLKNGPSIHEMARAAALRVQKVERPLLDQMAAHRPHNGVILEASKRPALPVMSLGTPDTKTGAIPVVLDRQTPEDIEVNGRPSNIPAVAKSSRQPFIIFLDGIVDEGNLGNILRTCHFYGVDAVAVATSTCAPLTSAIMAKASAGACEAVRVLVVPKPSKFIFDSAKAGWKVYAAVAPDDMSVMKAGAERIGSERVGAEGPLGRHPCILMLGAEGEGLRANLTNKADYLLSISRGASGKKVVDVGVDSLNVSVAAGVLMDTFLSKLNAAKGRSAGSNAGEGDLGF